MEGLFAGLSLREEMCLTCRQVFKSENALIRHLTRQIPCYASRMYMKDVHDNQCERLGLFEDSDSEELFECDKCDKTYKTAAGLKKHKSTHVVKQVFKCKWCDGVYKSQGGLTTHMKKCPCKAQGETKNVVVNFTC